MKTKNDQRPTQYEIPDGEGFNALPIAFNPVVARVETRSVEIPKQSPTT
jgi:hypothetical protein